jgi:hypothetical protein
MRKIVSMYGMSQDVRTEVPVKAVCVQFSRIKVIHCESVRPVRRSEPKKKKAADRATQETQIDQVILNVTDGTIWSQCTDGRTASVRTEAKSVNKPSKRQKPAENLGVIHLKGEISIDLEISM